MNSHTTAFEDLVEQFTAAVEANEGDRLASLFTLDGVYDDGFYGEFQGREAISEMLLVHFWGNAEGFRWKMTNLCSDGVHGYATYLFRYQSTIPGARGREVVFNGMSHYLLENGLIKRYEEVFSTGMAIAQLDFDADRIKKHLIGKAKLLKSNAGLV